MRPRDIPNAITIVRIALVVPAAWLLLHQAYVEALLVFALAGVSDGLDGYLAKRYGWHTRVGSILDPLADKLLLVTAYVVLSWLEHLPMWLVLAVIGRDVVLVGGALAYHWLIGRFDMAPTLISKLNTVAQIVLAFAVMYSLGVQALPVGLLEALVWLVLTTTVWSGVDYVLTWGVRAYRARANSDGMQGRGNGK